MLISSVSKSLMNNMSYSSLMHTICMSRLSVLSGQIKAETSQPFVSAQNLVRVKGKYWSIP